MPFLDYQNRLLWVRTRAAARKAVLIAEAGGACVVCGQRDGVLEFHHRDPGEKRFYVASSAGCLSMARMREEAAKCDLLCAPCHQELHRLASISAGSYCEPLDVEELADTFQTLANRWRS